MLTKSEFLAFLEREAATLSHLISKLQPQHLAFRLSPTQRSTEELMRYLATQWTGSISYFLSGNWDGWEASATAAANVTPATFAAAMARQVAEIRALLEPLSEADFAARASKDPTGNPMPLANAIFSGTVAWTAGYKMQLFLQLKAAGLSDLGSSNLWWGVERKAATA
jgi:hypothetical protein